jgi:hypothetical protein
MVKAPALYRGVFTRSPESQLSQFESDTSAGGPSPKAAQDDSFSVNRNLFVTLDIVQSRPLTMYWLDN